MEQLLYELFANFRLVQVNGSPLYSRELCNQIYMKHVRSIKNAFYSTEVMIFVPCNKIDSSRPGEQKDGLCN